MSVLGFLGNYAKNHTNAGRMVGQIQRYRANQQGIPGPPAPSAYGPPNPPGSMTNYPKPDPFDAGGAPSMSDASGGDQEQAMAGDDTSFGPEPAAKGILVTKPTIARLGESGPEAVVPLNNNPGNHVRPDMLEGHLQPPQIKGMRYQRFKNFANKAY